MTNLTRPILALVMAVCIQSGTAEDAIVTDLEELHSLCQSTTNVNRRFSVSGRLVHYYRDPATREWRLSIRDGARGIAFLERNTPDRPSVNISEPFLGELIRLSGILCEHDNKLYCCYRTAEVVSRDVPPDFILPCTNVSELVSRGGDCRLLRFSGVIRDFFRDESDPNFIHLTLNCNGRILHAMVFRLASESVDAARYIGARATVTGIRIEQFLRRQIGSVLSVTGFDHLRIDAPPVSEGELESLDASPEQGVPTTGLRETEGVVLCVWRGDHALLRTDAGSVVRIHFLSSRLPRVGERIVVRGIPETDLYHLNLVNAVWRSRNGFSPLPPARDIASARSLFLNDQGFRMIKIREHGNTLRLTGTVRYLPQDPGGTRPHIVSDGMLIPIELGTNRSVLANLRIGSVVRVTGTCVLDIDSYGIGTSIPRARWISLVLRTPDDLVVLSTPSWWTTGRLLTVLVILALLFAAVAVWTVSLHRLAERRGHALADEEVRRLSTELKVCERTNLAIELHDSLSQNLSGISMQIDAARQFAETDRPRMMRHLEFASRAIKSCRNELRNCLLDLRSDALETPDMNTAIRLTLESCSAEAEIAIRFSVPREFLSDNTAHTILSIIRELAANAIRHGHATRIKVAGSIENHLLKFSVKDNGSGFDPSATPGIAEGHFGLQGVRERIEHLEGTLAIESGKTEGTRISAEIPIHQDLTADDHA